MKVLRVRSAHPTQDGDGVKISRVADFGALTMDPFLMIDELKSDDSSDYIGGFPPHPHRGIETFTYIIKGGFEHKDQMGNKKSIGAGDVQWMSTGSGVMHSEIPLADEGTGMHGFQIWLNMPAKDKMRPAQYQDSTAQGLPTISNDTGASLKALAGSWEFAGHSVTSPVLSLTSEGAIADLTLDADSSAELNLSDYEQVMLYIHTGSLDNEEHNTGKLVYLDPTAPIKITTAEQQAGMLILVGNKVNEKIVHMGPFVMNTQEEIQQAIRDYQTGKFGAIA